MFRKLRTLVLASLLVGGSLAIGASPGSATTQDPPAPFNPNLSEACGLDFVLVLDRSGSISNANAQDDVENAAKGFLGALKDTGSRAAIVSFATTASVDKGATPVTDGANLNALNATIDGLTYGGGTNWQDGLMKAHDAFTGLVNPLVVMITDGDPTYYWDPDNPGDIDGLGFAFDVNAFNAAVGVAEDIKGTSGDPGSHIFALGVGDINEAGLKGISGNDEWSGSNFASADWARIDDFDGLDDALHDIATDLCGGTITVTKKIDGVATGGWQFSANGQQQTTADNDGTARFVFDNVQPLEVNLTETVKDGYQLADASCTLNSTDITNGVKLTIGPKDIVTCTFENSVLGGGINVVKTASAYTVLAGTDVTYTYVVTNTGQVPLSDVGVTDDKCSSVTPISGDANTNERLDLTETWTFQCTSAIAVDTTNVATASGLPYPLGGTPVTDEASATVNVINPDVEIDKTGPAMAHEGDEIEFTITVTNTGDVDLFSLLVSDELLGWSEVIDELPADGEPVTFTVPYTVPAESDSVENVASVCPVEQEARLLPECDTDGHDVDVIHPAITIDKTAAPLSITDSGEVTYTYVVENTGDVTLTDVVVEDDVLGTIGTIDSLEAGGTATLTRTVTVNLSSPTRNVGTVTADDPMGDPVSDDDDAEITVVAGATTTTTTTSTTTTTATAPTTPTTAAPDTEPEAAPVTEVLGETVVQPGVTLPRTGAQVAATVLTGLALLGGGLGFRFAGRRRRSRES